MSRPSEKIRPSRPELEEKGRTQFLSEPPDGGFTAWLQVLGSFFIFFNTWHVSPPPPPSHDRISDFNRVLILKSCSSSRGVVNMYGAYQTYYQSALLSSESESNISWIGSIQGFFLFLLSMVAGPLYDAGYLRLLLLVGTFLLVLGMMNTSICRAYWHFILAQGAAIGIGDGLLSFRAWLLYRSTSVAKSRLLQGLRRWVVVLVSKPCCWPAY